jgi:hypothetical protein
MGAWMIPLHGQPPPQQNPFQAAAQGQQDALSAGSMMQQQKNREMQADQLAMENQQMQRDLADQSVIRQAWIDHQGDPDKILSSIGGQVQPKTAMAFQKGIADLRKEYSNISEEEAKARASRHDQYGGALSAWKGQSSNLPDEDRDTSWQSFLEQQAKTGGLQPAEYQAMIAAHPNAPSPADVDLMVSENKTLSSLATEAYRNRMATASEARATAAGRRADIAAQEGQAKLPGLQADAEAKERSNWSAKLSAATDQDSYDTIRGDIPHRLRPDSLPEKFDPDTTPDVIQKWGMTPAQSATAGAAGARDAERARHDKALEQHQAELTAIGWQRLNDKDKPTPNSTAKDVRQARIELDKAADTEQKLYGLRGSLANAISSGGKTYVDRLGNVIPMSKATAADNSSADALKQDMVDRYKAIDDRLSTSVLPSKYDAGARLGMQPKVSLDDAVSGIRSGSQKLFTPAPSAPPSAPAKPAATPAKPSKYTEADVRKRASVAGKDPEAAVKLARDHGLIQ